MTNSRFMNSAGTWCLAISGLAAGGAYADSCSQLAAKGLTYGALTKALHTVVVKDTTAKNPSPNGGLNFPMWLTLVDGGGRVCLVTNSLDGSPQNSDVTADIWLGSRVISAQKANTANSFSTGKLALSTANLYSAVQPGGSLFGLQESNPVDTLVAYQGHTDQFGSTDDPMVGQRIGGINVFGGGLALYEGGKKIGALGVSGDTSCTDHVVAWKVRAATGYNGVPVFGNFDAMFQDITVDPSTGLIVKASASGFGHPKCLNNPTPAEAGSAIIGN